MFKINEVIPFEIHITGDSSELNATLTDLGIKNIIVELLKPDNSVLRTEHMSSFVRNMRYNEIHQFVLDLVTKLAKQHNIIRVKIESPPILELFPMSLYVESHFIPRSNKYALSRNVKSGKLMGTDREYNKNEYQTFLDKWQNEDCELCVFDSFKEEDFDWLSLYNQ